jgi:hypothetical protein
MNGKCWRLCVLVVLLAFIAPYGTRAEEDKDKVPDGGKAEKFKGKTFDLKEKGKAKITLTFPAGKTFNLTVRSKKKTDVNLFVYDSDDKQVAKDDSEGPSCDIKFTPKKAGKYTLEVVNLGPGANSSKLTVAVAKKKPKKYE